MFLNMGRSEEEGVERPPSQPTEDESHPLVGAEDGRPVQHSSTPVAMFPNPDLSVPAPPALAPWDRNARMWAEVVGTTNASPLSKGRGIRKLLWENYPEIDHQFDVWHISKSITKKLTAKAKRKGCEDLGPWIRAVTNHL